MISVRQVREYDVKCEEYFQRYRNGEDVEDEMYKFQTSFMEEVLSDFKRTIPAREAICEILEYVIYSSNSGNSIVQVDNEQIANEAKEILYDELGEYLLDVQIYERNGEWNIDTTFGGYYVPRWDGICDV